MIGKLGVMLAGLLILTWTPTVTADAGNCTGRSIENTHGGDDCVGACSNQNEEDSCVGVCTDGSCGGIWEIIWGTDRMTYEPDSGNCYGVVDAEGNCIGVEGRGCERIIPEQTIFNPLNGQPVYTVNIKTELCT
jgi:hypothetical protein